MTVYLRPGGGAGRRAEELAQALEQRSRRATRAWCLPTRRWRGCSAAGRARVRRWTGSPENPLPRTVELTRPRRPRDPGGAEGAGRAGARAPGRHRRWTTAKRRCERLSAIATRSRWAAWSPVVAGGGLATIVIVSATLQLAIYARREEIEIQKLVGATDRFVKAPFLIEGAAAGRCWARSAPAPALWAFAAFAGPQPGVAVLLPARAAAAGPAGRPAALVAELFGAGRGAGAVRQLRRRGPVPARMTALLCDRWRSPRARRRARSAATCERKLRAGAGRAADDPQREGLRAGRARPGGARWSGGAAAQVQQLETDLKLMRSRVQLAERQEAVANLAAPGAAPAPRASTAGDVPHHAPEPAGGAALRQRLRASWCGASARSPRWWRATCLLAARAARRGGSRR